MANQYKIIIIIMLLLLIFLCVFRPEPIIEHLDNSEAIKNIASIYNKEYARFDNLEISKDLITPALKSSTNIIDVKSPLQISNSLCVDNVCINAKMLKSMIGIYNNSNTPTYMYSKNSSDSVIYDDIFSAFDKGIVSKNGAPPGYDDTGYRTALWNGYKLLHIGNGTDANPIGITVNVPQNMNVIWIRVLNERWATITVKGMPTNVGGHRNIIKMRPDGNEDTGTNHRWVPYPVLKSGTAYNIYGSAVADSNNWISGIGFSTNPYNHIMSSAVTYHWALNGTSSGISVFYADGAYWWNSDQLAYITNSVKTFMVPVIKSGKDKFLYFLCLGREPDNTYVSQCKLTVNGKSVLNFQMILNKFSTYYTRPNLSYLSTYISADLIADSSYLTVTIDASNLSYIYFREIGTHDAY